MSKWLLKKLLLKVIEDEVVGSDLPMEQPFDDTMEAVELFGNRLFRKGANWVKAEQRQVLKQIKERYE